jgi:sirohydrochlorin ferrochelatase
MKGGNTLMLLDNGSLEPGAVLSLVRIAERLSIALGRKVHPVSLLHSHKIAPEKLGGLQAWTFERFIRSQYEQGRTRFGIIPLFFGPSGALTDYLPGRISELNRKSPALEISLAPCLADSTREGDKRLAELLEIQLRRLEPQRRDLDASVILVDHGSPKREVTAVRDHLAVLLGERLGKSVHQVIAASMERRSEAGYDFNEPLLEKALADIASGERRVILSLLFLSPGRHAGPGGDIHQICEKAKKRRPELELLLAPLLGEAPELIPLLVERAKTLL